MIIAFSLGLVATMVGGTVWILYNLAMRMMP
jgi:heme/copper-type cytochrome/quinol oxidase subunit 4